MSWTDERVERLKKMWAEGLTASHIAKELGDVTRNAVIGKVHRLGLSGRAKSTRKPVKRTVKTTNAATIAKTETVQAPIPQPSPTIAVGNTALKSEVMLQPAAMPQRRQVEELIIPLHQRASILQLNEHRCKWPIGDPTQPDFHYCGRQKDPAKSYCDHHCGVAYQSQDRKR